MPVHPGMHMHIAPPLSSLHVPPLAQGLGLQGTVVCVSHSTPVHPCRVALTIRVTVQVGAISASTTPHIIVSTLSDDLITEFPGVALAAVARKTNSVFLNCAHTITADYILFTDMLTAVVTSVACKTRACVLC